MAKITEVKRQRVESVTLTLDNGEIRLLSTLLGRVGGNPDNSMRKYATSIIKALDEAGIDIHEYGEGGKIDYKLGGPATTYFIDGTER